MKTLDGFIKRRKKSAGVKMFNVEELSSIDPNRSLQSESQCTKKMSADEDTKTPHTKAFDISTCKNDAITVKLPCISESISESLCSIKNDAASLDVKNSSSEEHIIKIKDIKTQKINHSSSTNRNIYKEPIKDTDKSFKIATSKLGYSLSNVHLFLPKNFKLISSLYKVLCSVYKFNSSRGLSLILEKYRDSIERLFKRRVEHRYLEELQHLCNSSLELTPVNVFISDTQVKTYTIKIHQEVDIDRILYEFYIGSYRQWLSTKNITGTVVRFHEDFIKENILIIPENTKEDIKENTMETSEQHSRAADENKQCKKEANIDIHSIDTTKSSVKDRMDDILKRVREKEMKRKEEFIKEQTKHINYKGKIESVFKITNKRAIKLAEIIEKLNLGKDVNGIYKENILRVVEEDEKYTIRKIGEEDYILRTE
ncbi:hypothetical protein ENBRE01_1504 [Enteropsectra breve]|nr:hypothetical protein ENBRE01_1504 [Enteropsectra breve]